MIARRCPAPRSRGAWPRLRRRSGRVKRRPRSSPRSGSRRSIAPRTARSGGSCARPARAPKRGSRVRRRRSVRRALRGARAPRQRCSLAWAVTLAVAPRSAASRSRASSAWRGRNSSSKRAISASRRAMRPGPCRPERRLPARGGVPVGIGSVSLGTSEPCGQPRPQLAPQPGRMSLHPLRDQLRNARGGRVRGRLHREAHHAGLGTAVGHDAHASHAEQGGAAVPLVVEPTRGSG